jgi:methylmalonyl-CoA/ethylmalonyl-CoA epimerase
MNFKIDHIGYVVKNLKSSQNYFLKIFKLKKISKTIYEKAHGVKIVFLDMGRLSMPALELIQPMSPKSKVYNHLLTKGEGFHHFAYEVLDIQKSINYMKKKGCYQVGNIVPGAGHNHTDTVWLFTPRKELVELILKQKQKSNYSRFTK